ncbi:MAG TPA: ATP-binding protein [Paracoccaceae bacterium]|nr:ATP-binding protein [Paracoccaceae bacterium]
MDAGLIASLVEGIPLPALVVGADDRVSVANPPAEALLGPGIAGRHFMMAMRQPLLVDRIEAALRRAERGQARITLATGPQDAAYRVTVAPLAGGAGALCVYEDISEQEQVGQMRRDFVANVSHELRTPLTALMGFIETLKGAARNDPAARDRFLAIMEREAGRMNRLVRDLLSLSRVESEERVRPTDMVDVASLAATVVATLRPMAEAAGVQVDLTGAATPALIRGDADQITQVLHNLIENGVKYGGAGKLVTVALAEEPRDPALRGPALRLSVTDRGEGIDPIHLPRLTERFYRVDSHRSREKGGTGLGLAIVKHIVNRHRGRLLIDSTPGAGSTFTILLPLA